MAQGTDSTCRTMCWLGSIILGGAIGTILHHSAGLALVPSVLIGGFVIGAGGVIGPGILCRARAGAGQGASAVAVPARAAPVSAAPVVTPAEVAPASAPVKEARMAPRVSGPSGPHDAARPVSGLDAALARAQRPQAEPAPEFLSAPRGGRADDLKLIRGIGPKLERLLNEAGVWHFDQISGWRARDIALVDEKMTGFHGRIARDEWVRQARDIVAARKGEG